MHLYSHTVALGATFAALAAAQAFDSLVEFDRYAPRTSGIHWKSCGDPNIVADCGRFEVPLDYQNPKAGKASLAVARYAATKKPRLGTLFINPGGPGGSGVDTILSDMSELISQAVGGQYDVIGWDPRGVGRSVPSIGCFASAKEEAAFWEGTIPFAGLEARGNFTSKAELAAFFDQVPKVDELLVRFGKKCLEYSPDTLQYVGTAAVVRDMVALHDYVEGPEKKVDYWGFSYGTAIGSYFVNMFPDRVGRVAIDGVVNPAYWADRPPYEFRELSAESTDETLAGFAHACATVGSGHCALATQNSTAYSIKTDILNIINRAYDYKKVLGASAQFGSADVRGAILDAMYHPAEWARFAKKLLGTSNFLTNSSNWHPRATKRSSDLPFLRPLRLYPLTKREASSNESSPANPHTFEAIRCADAVDAGNTTTMDVFEEIVKVTRKVSHVFGPMWVDPGFYCHHWPVRAVERYTGPWNKHLANPILVIGNKADPITPFQSAKWVADTLGNSAVLVEQDDYGHTSLAMHSSCTLAILKRFFTNGKLPLPDELCATNQELFPGTNVTKTTLSAFQSKKF